jgi:hypothetical protein
MRCREAVCAVAATVEASGHYGQTRRRRGGFASVF